MTKKCFMQPSLRYGRRPSVSFAKIGPTLQSVGFDAVAHSFFNPYTTLRTEEATILSYR